MPHRSILLFTSAAALGLSAPALAQDDRYSGLPDYDDMPHAEHMDHGDDGAHSGHSGHMDHYDSRAGSYDGEWQGRWDGSESWHGEWNGLYTDADGRTVEAQYHGVWMGESRFVSEDGRVLNHDGHGWREHHGGRHDYHRPRLAYGEEERQQWLADCQFVMSDPYYEEDRRGGNGGLIGGLLGAVVGGVAGNRIADGDRLLGTAVGAGLGGLAGAAIGSVLDSDGDGEINRQELWAARYCEAYLARYEAGGGWGQTQAVMMVPVGYGHRRSRGCGSCGGETVIIEEEWVEIEEPAPRPRPRPRPRPAPEPDKRNPIR